MAETAGKLVGATLSLTALAAVGATAWLGTHRDVPGSWRYVAECPYGDTLDPKPVDAHQSSGSHVLRFACQSPTSPTEPEIAPMNIWPAGHPDQAAYGGAADVEGSLWAVTVRYHRSASIPHIGREARVTLDDHADSPRPDQPVIEISPARGMRWNDYFETTMAVSSLPPDTKITG